jgi:hypothetical protein
MTVVPIILLFSPRWQYLNCTQLSAEHQPASWYEALQLVALEMCSGRDVMQNCTLSCKHWTLEC